MKVIGVAFLAVTFFRPLLFFFPPEVGVVSTDGGPSMLAVVLGEGDASSSLFRMRVGVGLLSVTAQRGVLSEGLEESSTLQRFIATCTGKMGASSYSLKMASRRKEERKDGTMN